MGTGRRLIVRDGDVLVLGGWELPVTVLRAVIEPSCRLLWAFVKSEQGSAIQPVAYDEERVIWLEEGDIERAPDEVRDLCRE